MSNPADFFAVPKDIPANFKFTTQWEMLLYGNDLAQKDFQRFRSQYPSLLANSDFYTAAFLTDMLVKGGINDKVDVFDDITHYINSNSAKPDIIGAAVLGLFTTPNPTLLVHADEANKVAINKVLDLVKQEATPDSPDWAVSNGILRITKLIQVLNLPLPANPPSTVP